MSPYSQPSPSTRVSPSISPGNSQRGLWLSFRGAIGLAHDRVLWRSIGLGLLVYLWLLYTWASGPPQRKHSQGSLSGHCLRHVTSIHSFIYPSKHPFLHSPAPADPHTFDQLTSISKQSSTEPTPGTHFHSFNKRLLGARY